MDIVSCIVTVAPLRREDSHRSEIVTELLFGERAELLEKGKDFVRLRCLYDDYEGWCQRTQVEEMASTTAATVASKFISVKYDEVQAGKQSWPVTFASPVHGEGNIAVGRYTIRYNDKNIWDATNTPFEESKILICAKMYLHTPYLWGGKSVLGIDCSGFAQQVYKMFGMILPRDAWQQAEKGEVVGFLQQARCGDLAFFDNEEGKIIHVGLLLNDYTIIHSSGKVRIDQIDNAGIISSDTGERTHKLRIIKRY